MRPPRGECAVAHVVEAIDIALPFARYHEAYRDAARSFLLDGAGAGPGARGRYSLLGGVPDETLIVRRSTGDPGVAEITREARDGTQVTSTTRDPFAAIGEALADRAIDPAAYVARPGPFLAGAAGYVAYDAARFLEELPDRTPDDVGAPIAVLLFVDDVVVHDHLTGATHVSALGRARSDHEARRCARDRARATEARLRRFEQLEAGASARRSPHAPRSQHAPRAASRSPFDARSYAAMVRRAQEHIARGDVFEVCLAHRFEAPFDGDDFALHAALRHVSPAPFGAHLRVGDLAIVSCSPERFVRLGEDGVVESRPIKGTRPRGATPDDDARLAQDLATHPKDAAEHVMIVDLVRSDLGLVARPGSVHVPELAVVEAHPTVHQLVSTIRAELDGGRGAIDLLRAAFPAGSITGAPKIEAMKIIERLEPVKRGIYTGSIGYFDAAGSFDLNVAIRTLVLAAGRATFHVGGAIVADSDPLAEHQETLDKARALLAALELAS